MGLFFGPAPANPGQKFVFVLSHLPDERLIAGVLVRRRPEDHFGEDGRETDPFGRQPVDQLSPVRGVLLGGDNSMSFELAQPVGQNVRRDSLVGFQEFFVGPESPEHHVADNQKGPAVTEHLHGSVQGTPRAPMWADFLLWHGFRLTYFHLQNASELGMLPPVARRTFSSGGISCRSTNCFFTNSIAKCLAPGKRSSAFPRKNGIGSRTRDPDRWDGWPDTWQL